MVKTILLNRIKEYKDKGFKLVHLATIDDINVLKEMDCLINVGDKKVEIMCKSSDASKHHLMYSDKPLLLSLPQNKVSQLLNL